MKNPAIRDRLQDVVAFGREAVDAAGDLTVDQIEAERFREHTVLRTVQIVGEASGRLLKLDPTLIDRIPDLRRAVDLRNTLVHGYMKIRLEEVVRIIRHDLPGLIERAAIVLGEDYE